MIIRAGWPASAGQPNRLRWPKARQPIAAVQIWMHIEPKERLVDQATPNLPARSFDQALAKQCRELAALARDEHRTPAGREALRHASHAVHPGAFPLITGGV